jgi:hypothetical protein
MDLIRDQLREVVGAGQPMTVRQVFYQLVSRGVNAKTETEYKGTVGRLLTEMRLLWHRRYGDSGFWDFDFETAVRAAAWGIPFEGIADNTRWMRKPNSFTGPEAALNYWANAYRRDLWADTDAYVEVWLEKEALAGVVVDVTAEYDVPLMVTRGYPSLSFVYSAAEKIMALDKPAHLYYFGDRDPSGVDIPRNVQDRIEEFGVEDFEFEIVAVTPAPDRGVAPSDPPHEAIRHSQ